jgi:hypothetical protein
LSRKCPDEIDTSGVRLEEDGTQKARLWLVRANDLPEMDEFLTLRFNGLYYNMIKNIAETGGGWEIVGYSSPNQVRRTDRSRPALHRFSMPLD